jgi:hypothetical protein
MNVKTFFTALLFILLSGTLSPADSSQESITMNLPNSVIKAAIDKSLPLDFKIQSNTLLGSISIDKIENLQFRKDKLSSRITLSGHKLNIVTSIGGHDLRMKIGTLTMSFQCDATIRFDAPSQTLFLTPKITDLQSSNNKKTDVASAIVLLFNNREFPLQIEKLTPIVTDIGNKFLNISMDIVNIELQPNNLRLSITPTIEATPKQKNGIEST